MAEAWLVLKITGSGAAVGAMFACRFGPILFFGMLGRRDRRHFDRRRVLLITQSLASVLAVVLWLIVFTDVAQVWMLYAIGFALGLVVVVDEPARQAFVEEMVGPEKVPNAGRAQQRGDELRPHHRARARGHPHHDGRYRVVFFVNAVLVHGGRDRARRDAQARAAPLPPPGDADGSARGSHVRVGRSSRSRSTILHATGVVGTLVYNFPTFLTLMGARHVPRAARVWAGLLMAILGAGTVIVRSRRPCAPTRPRAL